MIFKRTLTFLTAAVGKIKDLIITITGRLFFIQKNS
jgi:hypothetical protein